MRSKVLIYICIWVILILEGVKIYLGQTLEVKGADLYQLENQVHELSLINNLLYTDLLKQEALTTTNNKARQEGFINSKILYIVK